ncbi:HoxN/HupN/NixA family nickel/cobalt transporter [Priestia sp. JNUCC 25]
MNIYRGSFKYILIVVILHIAGFIGLYISLPQHPFLLGMGVLAYTLGLRHAFDIDHIAAIDTTVRKLVEQKKNPAGVGFFFSLGHSTVVFLLAIFTSFSVKFVKNNLPQMQDIGGLIGTVVSGTFLVIMGVINLVILLNIIGVFKKMRKKNYKESELEVLLNSRGFLTPVIQPLFKFINKSWHVYPIGFLFGLGFDTASEIALLTLSAGAAQHNLSFVSILSLPILFAAGMSLMDTLDGAFMTSSYNWAFDKPIRKVYYNITITTLSVIAAIFVGFLELIQIIGEKLHIRNNWFKIIDKLDLGDMGYILVIMFILVWSIAYFIWKYFNIEEKWSMHV